MVYDAYVPISLTGVGISIDYLPTNNNSVVIADSDDGYIFCSTGNQQPNVGQWIGPSDNDLAISGLFDVFQNPLDFIPSYVYLQLYTSPPADELGLHKCVLPDENGIERELFVWIFQEGYQQGLLYFPSLIFVCTGKKRTVPHNHANLHSDQLVS